MSVLLAPLLVLFAAGAGGEDGASNQLGSHHQVLRAAGPSASRFPAGGRLAPGTVLELARGDAIVLLGPQGTRRYRGPGRFRVGEPQGLSAMAGRATVRIDTAATRFPGGSIRSAIVAGGGIDIAEGVGAACSGFVSETPDGQFVADGKDLPIIISVLDRSENPPGGTLSLLVNDPGGQWYCSTGVNAAGDPAIAFPRQRAGRYDIWVGYSLPGVRRAATLDIVD